jgi:alkanesulfonate monooxygenase SsuD/methylene tetrahydromethanopterin reductase-like flavin-dependent oxidoreductase (luciferase family)
VHVGLSLTFQNFDGGATDAETVRHELSLARRAEPAGFDSVWLPEHHFTGHTMTPSVPEVLAWIAGQTERIKLGTMVQVLPWNHPARVVENFVMLDYLSGGRGILGIGRGLGRSEFEGLGVEMGHSRRLFTEYTGAIVNALETGVLEHDGELYQQAKVTIRPQPHSSYRGRTYASAISPQSIDLMARLKVGLMVIAQKPWETVREELAGYRARYVELNGEEPLKPLLVCAVATHENEAGAQRMRDIYLQRYARSTTDHYEFANVEFANIEGYEYYGRLADNIERYGLDQFNSFLADLQIWGTPDHVTSRILDYASIIDAGAVILLFSFGGMPTEEVDANFELFTREVLPRLNAHDVGGDIGVTFSNVPAGAIAT